MAAGDLTNMNGLFKTVYADKIQDLIPEYTILQKRLPFVAAEKETGNYYAQPVLLSHESGFSYLGETGAVGSLASAVSMTMAEAQVKGTEIVLRSQLSYGALARASKAGPKAFKRSSSWLVEDMNNAARKRLEISMLYGRRSIGKVSSVSGQVITITDATWCPGIWAGSEGTYVEFFDGVAASATKDGPAADHPITAVDFDNKTITVSGDLTTTSAVNSDSYIWFKGARTATAHNDMAGLAEIVQNTGTLFNISASTYSLWKGTTVSSVGQPSHAKLQDAIAKGVSKGLMTKVLVLVPPRAFGVLNSDQSALRVFDSSYSKGKGDNGFESLVFHSTNGQCEIVSHPLVKDGDMFIVPIDEAARLGSVDLSFGVPGMDEQFFSLVSGSNAVELQCMADQAIFLEKPAHSVFMTGLTYS